MSEFSNLEDNLANNLPDGERLLWQGAPDWRALAVSAFHVRKVAIYFAILAAWGLASGIANGQGIVISPLWIPAVIAIAVLCGIAWLTARTTRYIITNRRVLLKFGIALPMTLNLPLHLIGSADLKVSRNGTGDLALATLGSDRLAFLVLWPHARPWRLTKTEPMLRALADPQAVAEILGQALVAVHGRGATQTPETSTSQTPAYANVAAA